MRIMTLCLLAVAMAAPVYALFPPQQRPPAAVDPQPPIIEPPVPVEPTPPTPVEPTPPAQAPEPGTMVLAAIAIGSAGAYSRWRKGK